MAQAFGARVATARVEHGLYLVVGRERSPYVLVRSAGGEVVMQISGSFTLLATMPFTSFLGLRRHPYIKHIGPVALDHARFEQFAAAAGLDLAPDQDDTSG
jgi:hypothetical protein